MTTLFTPAAAGASGHLDVVVLIILVALLVEKELATAASTARASVMQRTIDVLIVPLVLVWLVLAALKVVTVLQGG